MKTMNDILSALQGRIVEMEQALSASTGERSLSDFQDPGSLQENL
jgi:hypothetical protein